MAGEVVQKLRGTFGSPCGNGIGGLALLMQDQTRNSQIIMNVYRPSRRCSAFVVTDADHCLLKCSGGQTSEQGTVLTILQLRRLWCSTPRPPYSVYGGAHPRVRWLPQHLWLSLGPPRGAPYMDSGTVLCQIIGRGSW